MGRLNIAKVVGLPAGADEAGAYLPLPPGRIAPLMNTFPLGGETAAYRHIA